MRIAFCHNAPLSLVSAALLLLLLPLVSLAQQSTSDSSSVSSRSDSRLNGWYACLEFTFEADGSSKGIAECAIYRAPLCYPSVCKDLDTRRIDVFVKRIRATVNAESAPNVWFLEGGPGLGSTDMEGAMVTLHEQLNGNVNVYTMDHRGTGRSTRFDCTAAQASTSGSPWGYRINASEVPSCAADLEFKFGSDLAAFSTTSAATDVSTIISEFQNSTGKTFVFGVSYGTALVERLIHLENRAIAGYVLDGICTTSGSNLVKFENFSTWDTDFSEVGDVYLSACDNDPTCASKFPGSTLTNVLTKLLASLDASPPSRCATLVRNLTSDDRDRDATEPVSFAVRERLGSLLQAGEEARSLIPALVYRLNRCSAADVEILTHFFTASASVLSPTTEASTFESKLLYDLIVFSEMWESPSPSFATMRKRFADARITNIGAHRDMTKYCAFSKERSETCASLQVPTYSASPLLYKRDKHWNVAAELPPSASVLLLSSKMDPDTPHKYAEYLLDTIKGKAKELITFEHATHGTLWTTLLSDDDPKALTCGMRILLSYVQTGGDLTKLDKSCVAQMPKLSFGVDEDMLTQLFSTDDAFDGVFDASLSSDASSSDDDDEDATSYKTEFIVFLVLFLVTLVVANEDEQSLDGDVSVKPSSAAIFMFDGMSWRALTAASFDTAVMTGVTRFEAANDLNVGDIKLTAKSVQVASQKAGYVAIYSKGGGLAQDDTLSFDAATGTLAAYKLRAEVIQGSIDMSESELRHVEIVGGHISNVNLTSVERMEVDGELFVELDAFFGSGITVDGQVMGSGAYVDASDARFKIEVEPIRNALDAVTALDGVTYRYRTNAFPAKKFSHERELGFIAQQVEHVLPEVVSEDADGFKYVAYARIVPVVVEALKELRSERLQCKDSIDALRSELAEMKSLLAQQQELINALMMQQTQTQS